MNKDYPFPASRHEILFQPAPPGMKHTYTLGDILSGKVILNFGQVEFCECGAVYEMPETVREMALRLAKTLPLDTPMVYGLSHLYDETVIGVTEEEIIARLEEWRDSRNT
jgi:hypothetical protein